MRFIKGFCLNVQEAINFNETIFAHFEKEEMNTFFAVLKKINKIIDETK